MKRITYIVLSLVLIACTERQSVDTPTAEQNVPMAFSSMTRSMTRLGGPEAATLLNDGVFYVYATKNEAAGDAGQMVMENYGVRYTEGTANSTTSNTAGWEYVGGANYDSTVVQQTIKYWDYAAADYAFYAISLPETVTMTNVVREAVRTDNGFLLSGTTGWDKVYVADRIVTTKAGYGSQVVASFHNLTARVRVGMYETVPGYSLHVDKMYGADTDESTTAFLAACPNYSMTVTQTARVSYDAENKVKVALTGSPTKLNTLTLGSAILSAEAIGSTTSMATKEDYVSVMPQEENETDMTVKIDFTLTTTDQTKEQIVVKGATATVPSAYVRWRAGYAYTYIFKVSDNTNGQIGSLVGLYPITFYGVVITNPDGEERLYEFKIEDEKFGLGDMPGAEM